MFALQPSEIAKVEPLFVGMEDHLGLYAMLHGCITGEVFVDHPATPRAALARIHQRRFFLAGLPGETDFIEKLRGFFTELVYPISREKNEKAFLVYYNRGGWQETLNGIFKGTELIHAERQYYVCKNLQIDRRASLPDGFELRSVDWTLLADQNLKNIDILVEEMCSERTSVEDFLQHSFGVCATFDSEITGMCLSEYNCLDRCEVGIITMEAYQRRGLATALVSALIKEAQQRGIAQIGWHCFTRNRPSVATALKAGFIKQADYPVCIVRIPPG
jgi:RimJ/RimL family protein N-acetyltransferase